MSATLWGANLFTSDALYKTTTRPENNQMKIQSSTARTRGREGCRGVAETIGDVSYLQTMENIKLTTNAIVLFCSDHRRNILLPFVFTLAVSLHFHFCFIARSFDPTQTQRNKPNNGLSKPTLSQLASLIHTAAVQLG